jgi:hypothetical protein
MTRTITPSVAAAIAADRVARTVAVELDFPSGVSRWNASLADIVIDGNVFLGVGNLGTISVTEESAELRAYGLTLVLSGIPRDTVALGLLRGFQNRRGTVWEVPLDPNTFEPLASPVIIFRGRMDTLDVQLGDTGTVTVALENRLADWDRPRIRRYTDEDQQAAHPGDTGLRFVPATTDKEITWPGREFFEYYNRRK